MGQILTITQLKERIEKIEKYFDSHPACEGMENWLRPDNKDYWPVRWIMEYLTILKERYYRIRSREKINSRLITK